MCDAAPVSVGDRLKHARQLRGFHHGIFTPSWDAQQLFNLVGASARGFGRCECGRRACIRSRDTQRGAAVGRCFAPWHVRLSAKQRVPLTTVLLRRTRNQKPRCERLRSLLRQAGTF